MQKKQIIGYDETKKMLNTLRSLNESKINISRTLREQEEVSTEKQLDDVIVINDVEVKLLSTDKDDMKIMDDQKETISQMIDNFKEQVSQIVDFDPGMTITEKQIRLDGTINVENTDIGFVFIAGEESGIYINADMMKIDDHVTPLIEKLTKFNEVYGTAMEPIISQRNNN
jgi:hypothetical protein